MLIRSAKHFDVIQIQQGAYVAIAKEGAGAMANTGFVDLGETILVFDSFNTQQAAAELRDAITSITGKPISHLINSHWHGDHIRGNQIFRDVSIVATEYTKRIMQENHPARIARQRAGLNELHEYIENLERQQNSTEDGTQRTHLTQQISFLKEIEISLPTLELVLPNETFETTWYTEGTNQRVECHTLGGGHTVSDSFLYIPDARICYIGDLVAVNNHMLIVDGNIQNWISILDELRNWEFDYVVPGHGQIGGKEWIERAADYLSDLLETSNELREKGYTEVDIGALDIPEKYKTWAASEVYLKNIQHLLREDK